MEITTKVIGNLWNALTGRKMPKATLAFMVLVVGAIALYFYYNPRYQPTNTETYTKAQVDSIIRDYKISFSIAISKIKASSNAVNYNSIERDKDIRKDINTVITSGDRNLLYLIKEIDSKYDMIGDNRSEISYTSTRDVTISDDMDNITEIQPYLINKITLFEDTSYLEESIKDIKIESDIFTSRYNALDDDTITDKSKKIKWKFWKKND